MAARTAREMPISACPMARRMPLPFVDQPDRLQGAWRRRPAPMNPVHVDQSRRPPAASILPGGAEEEQHRQAAAQQGRVLFVGTRQGLWIDRPNDRRADWAWTSPRFDVEEFSCMIDATATGQRLLVGDPRLDRPVALNDLGEKLAGDAQRRGTLRRATRPCPGMAASCPGQGRIMFAGTDQGAVSTASDGGRTFASRRCRSPHRPCGTPVGKAFQPPVPPRPRIRHRGPVHRRCLRAPTTETLGPATRASGRSSCPGRRDPLAGASTRSPAPSPRRSAVHPGPRRRLPLRRRGGSGPTWHPLPTNFGTDGGVATAEPDDHVHQVSTSKNAKALVWRAAGRRRPGGASPRLPGLLHRRDHDAMTTDQRDSPALLRQPRRCITSAGRLARGGVGPCQRDGGAHTL